MLIINTTINNTKTGDHMFAHFDGFSKSVETLFGRNKEKPENVKLFEGLFAGIKKNTVLLPLINGIAAEDPKLITLLNAIQLGNVDDEIYKDRHCDIYLLRLIKDNKIDFYHGMTVYTYLTCLSQFTSRRSLLTKDKKREK